MGNCDHWHIHSWKLVLWAHSDLESPKSNHSSWKLMPDVRKLPQGVPEVLYSGERNRRIDRSIKMIKMDTCEKSPSVLSKFFLPCLNVCLHYPQCNLTGNSVVGDSASNRDEGRATDLVSLLVSISTTTFFQLVVFSPNHRWLTGHQLKFPFYDWPYMLTFDLYKWNKRFYKGSS